MNRMYVLPKDELGELFYRRIYQLIKKDQGAWATRGAAFGLIGGMLSIVLGMLLWVVVPLLALGDLKSFLYILETMFFVLPLPLMALGAHCLDLLEKTSPRLPIQAKSPPAGFLTLHRLRAQRPHQN